MGDAAVDNVGAAHAPAHRVHAAVHLGDHAAADNPLLFQAVHIADVYHRDDGAFIVPVPQKPPHVCHENQLHGSQLCRNAGGRHVRVDVIDLPMIPCRHSGDYRHIAVFRGVVDDFRVYFPDFPHQAQVLLQLVGL